jgi:hypothetical protein
LKLETNKIRQGCDLIRLLADKSLLLSDRKLRKLARKNVRKFGFDDLEERPRQAIEKSLGNLRRPLRKDFAEICKSLDRWSPQSADTVPAEPHPPEKEPPRSSGRLSTS